MASKWEVGPTKDVIRAFMETLVDPRLPLRVSVNNPPSEDTHKSIARQIHAVVLLYNYYHRKQKLELEFLDSVSFCKLAVSLRPSLISFVKTIDESRSSGAENLLSVIETAIKNACDIAMSLDASKDVPDLEGCLVSKVAVLLIDLQKENCLLQFGAVTEGVWSLIEKEIDESNVNLEVEEVRNKKRKTDTQQASTGDSKYLQLAHDAVKDVAGIGSSDLEVLETHVVYSLSKIKSTTQFYMMHCSQSFNVNQRVPLKFLVESLQGPFAEKFGDSWTTTTLVEYLHMLPYVEFISSWLSRKDSCSQISSGYNAQSNKSSDKKDLDHIDYNNSQTKISMSEEVANENSEDEDARKKRRHSSVGGIASSVNALPSKEKHGHAVDESENRCDIRNSAKRRSTRITRQNLGNGGDKNERGSLSGPSRGLSHNIVTVDNATRKMNSMSGFTKTSPTSEDTRKKTNFTIEVCHQRRKNISSEQHDTHSPENGVDMKVTEEKGDEAISFSRTEIAASENSFDQLRALYKIKAENELASKDLQNALALLDRKRQELHSRNCAIEDALALYEHNMERIRHCGDVGLARKCIKYIISGNEHLLLKDEIKIQDKAHQPDENHSNPQCENRTRFRVTIFPGRSSCQDLEDICIKNNLRLPSYLLHPSSDGKFMSSVVVQSIDFNLSSTGGSELSPSAARESAASRLIAKLQDLCESTRDQS